MQYTFRKRIATADGRELWRLRTFKRFLLAYRFFKTENAKSWEILSREHYNARGCDPKHFGTIENFMREIETCVKN